MECLFPYCVAEPPPEILHWSCCCVPIVPGCGSCGSFCSDDVKPIEATPASYGSIRYVRDDDGCGCDSKAQSTFQCLFSYLFCGMHSWVLMQLGFGCLCCGIDTTCAPEGHSGEYFGGCCGDPGCCCVTSDAIAADNDYWRFPCGCCGCNLAEVQDPEVCCSLGWIAKYLCIAGVVLPLAGAGCFLDCFAPFAPAGRTGCCAGTCMHHGFPGLNSIGLCACSPLLCCAFTCGEGGADKEFCGCTFPGLGNCCDRLFTHWEIACLPVFALCGLAGLFGSCIASGAKAVAAAAEEAAERRLLEKAEKSKPRVAARLKAATEMTVSNIEIDVLVGAIVEAKTVKVKKVDIRFAEAKLEAARLASDLKQTNKQLAELDQKLPLLQFSIKASVSGDDGRETKERALQAAETEKQDLTAQRTRIEAQLVTARSEVEKRHDEVLEFEGKCMHDALRTEPDNDLHREMLRLADELGEKDQDGNPLGFADLKLRSGDDKGNDKMLSDPRKLVFGMPNDAAKGIEHFMRVKESDVRSGRF